MLSAVPLTAGVDFYDGGCQDDTQGPVVFDKALRFTQGDGSGSQECVYSAQCESVDGARGF